MGTFTYRARDEKGSLITGTLDGDGKQAVYQQLDAMGLFPISASEIGRGFSSLDDIFVRFQRVKYDDLVFFTRQLQTVVRVGIPLISGLKALEEQTSNTRLKAAIRTICQDVDRGQSFSDALSKHKGIFPELYTSMVKAGELGGSLEEVLERLSGVLEFQMRTKEMLKSALRYPMFVIGTLVIAFIVLINVVVPKFVPFFKGSKVALPLPTQILLLISDIMSAYGVFVISAIIAIIALFFLYIRTERGSFLFDNFKLKIPLIGPIILKICMGRFAFTLENLVRAGVPIVKTLEIVSRTVGNNFIARKVLEIGVKIERGRGISRPMRDAKIFPPLVIHLVSTGEETGSLEEMLREISTHYDREVTYSVARLSAWIEPILTAGLATMVLFLALAIFMPWWNMMSAMKGGG
jgi:type II secretory pathway component PulF